MKKIIICSLCLLLLIISFMHYKKNDETKIEKEKQIISTPMWIDEQTATPLHHLVLGDSFAKGHGSTNGGYAQVASEQLSENLQKEIIVDNLAINGSTTDRLLKVMEKEETRQKIQHANLITISIGGNNVLRLKKSINKGSMMDKIKMLNKEKDLFEEDLHEIVTTIRSLNPDALIVLTELYNPLKLDDSLASYADIFLDSWNTTIHSVSKENEPSIVLPVRSLLTIEDADLLYDQVHPNDKGYEKIADSFMKQILSYKYSS